MYVLLLYLAWACYFGSDFFLLLFFIKDHFIANRLHVQCVPVYTHVYVFFVGGVLVTSPSDVAQGETFQSLCRSVFV